MSSAKNSSDTRDDEERESELPDDGAEIADFLSQFSGGSHQFMVTRVEPRQVTVRGQPKRITGHLTTLLTPPTLDDLREQFGGGIYEIRVNSRTAKGPRFVTCRRVEIAGDPKLPPDETPPDPPAMIAPVAAPESPALVQQILEHTFEDKRRVEERFERERQRVMAERPTGPDPTLLQATIGAIERSQKAEIEGLRLQLERRDQELGELRRQVEKQIEKQIENMHGRSSPLENPEVLKVLFGRGHEDAARTVEQMRHELQLERDRHQRETEAERERHQRDIEAERERRTRELEAERRDHKQQIDLIERLHRSELDNLRTSHVQLVATKDENIQRLAEDVRTLKGASRPPDALGDLERVGKVVNAVRNFAPVLGGGDEVAASGWERLFDHAKPLLEKVADNLSKPAPVHVHPPAAPAPMAPRSGTLVPFRRAAPSAGVARHPSRPSPTAPPVTTPASTAASAATNALGDTPNPTGSSSTLAEGLDFLEAAFKGEKPVDEVSRTASSLFPKSELRFLVQAGPDRLADEIEKRSPDSLLVSPGGRRYLRELTAALKSHLEPSG